MEHESDELNKLREQNRVLGEQVKLLVRMERGLNEAQQSAERQIRQISALNSFSLTAATSSCVDKIVGEALDILIDVFRFDSALALVATPESGAKFNYFEKRPRSGYEVKQIYEWPEGPELLRRFDGAPIFLNRTTPPKSEQEEKALAMANTLIEEGSYYDHWRSSLFLPLSRRDGDSLGCIWAITCTEKVSAYHNRFGSNEQSMVDLLRRHLTSATDNIRLNLDLEKRVKTRTEELAKTLVDLEVTNSKLHQEMASRVDAERALARVQKVESLGQLTASLGHEINNPLTYVLANLEFISDQIQDENYDGGELLTALEEAYEGAERIAQLVHDIRQFSVADGLEFGPVDLGEVIDGAIKLAGKQVRYVGKLTSSRPDSLPHVHAQVGPLEQVVVNLLMNALEAISEEDKTDHFVCIDAQSSDNGYVELTVTDNGKGISPDEMEKVLDPFFTTKFAKGGTGLGLFVCHTLIDSMKGELSIDSTPRVGTTVRVRIPIAEPNLAESNLAEPDLVESDLAARDAAETCEITRPHDHDEQTFRILIIDDEASILQACRRLLHSHEVYTFDNGPDALKAYRHEPFDLVLCDLMMPGMSGREVFRAIDAMGAEHAQRIVFITGGAFTERDQKFLRSISNQSLQKPLDKKTLSEVISDLQRSKARPVR